MTHHIYAGFPFFTLRETGSSTNCAPRATAPSTRQQIFPWTHVRILCTSATSGSFSKVWHCLRLFHSCAISYLSLQRSCAINIYAAAPTKVLLPFLLMRTILIFTLANTMNVRRLMRSALAEGGKSTKVYSGRTEAESRVYYELTVSKERLHKKAMCVRSTILPPQPLRLQPLRPQTYSHTSSIWAPLGDMKDGTIRTASHNHETQEMRGPDKRFMSRL